MVGRGEVGERGGGERESEREKQTDRQTEGDRQTDRVSE